MRLSSGSARHRKVAGPFGISPGVLMKTHNIAVRPYAPTTDTSQLSRIWLEASRIAHPFIGERRLLQQQTLIEDKYLPSAETWVAVLDDEPAGFISLLDTFV